MLDLLIKNTYLHKVRALKPLFDLLAQEDPADILQHFGTREVLRDLRNLLVCQYAWAVPSPAAIQLIARFSPIVEVAAGTGYWAYLLGIAGADVVAYDAYAPVVPSRLDDYAKEPFFEVRKATALEAVLAHSERTLFLCWPTAGDPMAYEALSSTSAEHVIFVGWKDDDVTGCMEFHNRLRREWTLVEELDIPQWPEMRDRLFVYRRRWR
ncbi:MAG: class I SAM-dependent methyltransferase [Candidatus Obscuribacterales bacterium]|nr:class I SAM-dependent methyltransferase [Candidatus Obscuribacterales bacterium]